MDTSERNQHLSPLAERVLRIIKKHDMIRSGDGVVVGLSGGPDSTCLLHVLEELRPVLGIRSLHAVHINHCLRGEESERDQIIAEQTAQRLGATFDAFRYEIRKMAEEQGAGEEELGRRLRYAAFEHCCQKYQAARIATAHNLNDQTETVLMRLIRGTGIRGLAGIDCVRDDGRIIRPLLEIRRSEIEEYCEIFQLNPAIDSTNLQMVYTRNRLRLQLIPMIEKEYNPRLKEALVRLADQAAEADDFIRSEAVRYLQEPQSEEQGMRWRPEDSSLLPECFTELHPAVQRRTILEILDRTGAAANVTTDAIDRVCQLISSEKAPAETDLSSGFYVRKAYGRIWFLRRDQFEKKAIPEPVFLPVELLEEHGFAELTAGNTTVRMTLRERNKEPSDVKENRKKGRIALDWDGVLSKGRPLFRNRRAGDRFRPIGMTGRKKLQNYFTDRKIPRQERDTVILLAAGSDILAAGKEVSGDCPVTQETRWILTVEYVK